MARKFNVISSDGHLEVPPERWTKRVPAKFRERAPKMIELPNGGHGLLLEGLPVQEAQFLDLRAGRSPEQWGPFGMRIGESPGTGSAEQRVAEQDQDGLDAEVLFPAMMAGPVIWRSIKHDEVYKAIIRAYNDWMFEEYCAVAPERLIGVGVLPQTQNIEESLAEMSYLANKGARCVMLGNFPSGKDYPTPEDDRFWAAAIDLGIVVCAHPKFSSPHLFGLAAPPSKLFQYPKERSDLPFRRGLVEWVSGLGQPPAVSVTQMVLSGVFDRLPKLQFYFSETGLGWVPCWLEHADLWYTRHLGWAQEYLGFQPLKRMPSEYVREHIYWSVLNERVAIELRHHIGVNRIMFSTDFPHIRCEWPNTPKFIEEIYFDVPADEKYRVLAGNALEYFHLN